MWASIFFLPVGKLVDQTFFLKNTGPKNYLWTWVRNFLIILFKAFPRIPEKNCVFAALTQGSLANTICLCSSKGSAFCFPYRCNLSCFETCQQFVSLIDNLIIIHNSPSGGGLGLDHCCIVVILKEKQRYQLQCGPNNQFL